LKVAPVRLEQDKPQGPGRLLKNWHLDGLALLFFLALTIVMTWPVTPNMGRSLEQWGDALLQTWTLDWDAHALLTNPLHFANANAFYPYANSLAFSETLIGQAVLVAPVIWLTDNPVLAYNLLLLGSFGLCGWGMYLLGKELSGSRVAGLVAGVIFAFFPHRFGQLSHLHLLTAQWMPFCLLFLRRFLFSGQLPASSLQPSASTEQVPNRKSPMAPGHAVVNRQSLNGLMFGLFFVLQLLSSTYLGLFLVVAVGLYLIYHLVGWVLKSRKSKVESRKSGGLPPKSEINDQAALSTQHSALSTLNSSFILHPSSFNKLAGLCIILVIVGLVVLPFYWPYLAVQQDLGFERSMAEVQSFSAQPFYYLDMAKENHLNQWFYRPTFTQGWWQSSSGGERGLFLGFVAMALGAAGLVRLFGKKRDRDGFYYALLGLLAFSFTFGPAWQTGRFGAIPLPYALLYNYVPGFGAIRVPVRFIYVVALALAALAAFGVAWLQQRWQLQRGWKAVALACGLIGLLCFEYSSDVNLLESNILRQETPAAERWLNQHPAPTLYVPLSGSDNSNLFLQYWTRGSWRPIMNGFSGFMPPAYDALKLTVAREGFSPRVVDLLQGLEIRYVVIDTNDDTVKPQLNKLKSGLEQAQAQVAATFGGTLIYELKTDPWLARLKDMGMGPDSAVNFVEYQRNQGQLLELAASFLQNREIIKRENLYGSISVGFRPLPPLPAGKAADFLALASGEDPTLYGFRPADKIFGNRLLAVYKKSPDLLARYDFTRQDSIGALNRTQPLAIAPDGSNLKFNAGNGSSQGGAGYVTLGLAVLQAQKLTIASTGGTAQTLDLAPGLSIYRVAAGGGITIKGGTFSLAWAELWRGTPEKSGPELRSDVVLLSSSANYEEKDAVGVAQVQVVVPGQATGYSATLDIYNTPWGSHPNGHYGYWTLPLDAGNKNDTEWRLNLTRKQMATRINGRDVPNFPPDPKDLDLAKYGNYGDFRANLNLFAGAKLVGQTRLFDFTTWAQGDKNRIENRRAEGFKGYNTTLAFLVLPAS
jgi:hypothetical protein